MRSKLIWSLLLALGYQGLLAGRVRGEDTPAETPASLAKAAQPIVVDGVLDEACWKSAPPLRVDYINSKQGVLSDEPRMAVRYCWDDHYLYLAYETFDKNLVAIANKQTEGPADNRRPGCEIFQDGGKVDVAEFFISFDDSQFFWEIHHNAANQFNDVWCVVADPKSKLAQSSQAMFGLLFLSQETMQDDGPFRLATAVKLKPKADGQPSTINDPSDVDSGYTAEIRLPWLALGAPADARTWIETKAAKPGESPTREPGPWKMADRTLQILAVAQDGDLPERYHHSSPRRNGDWFHKTQPLWPTYRLAP